MWQVQSGEFEEDKEPRFLEADCGEFKNFKVQDLKGKFGAFFAFPEQYNHIYAFAKALFDKLQLSSTADYKCQLVSLMKQRATFCDVKLKKQVDATNLNHYDRMKDFVRDTFKDSILNFDAIGLDASEFESKFDNNGHREISNYEYYCLNTLTLKILSTLFGVSSVVYTEISYEDKECEIEVFLPELQGLRPILYFYAFANYGGSYTIYTMTTREDLLNKKQRKRIVMSKTDQLISENLLNLKPLLGYMKDVQSLYNKVLSVHLGENNNPEAFEKEIIEDLALIRANKRCNNLNVTLKALTGREKLSSKILKYEQLKLNHTCDYCLGLDNVDDKIFSLDCNCFTHASCINIYVKNFLKNYGNLLKCICGADLNIQLILSLIEKETEELYLNRRYSRNNCYLCKKTTISSDPHYAYCNQCLCEECSIKNYRLNMKCSVCAQHFDTVNNQSKILCKLCNVLKPIDEIYIPKDDYMVACYECILLKGFDLNNELNTYIYKLTIRCENDNCYSRSNNSTEFLHPSKITCPQCVNVCFNCVMNSNGSCPLCDLMLRKQPEVITINLD